MIFKCNECYAESSDGSLHYSSCPSHYRTDISSILASLLRIEKLLEQKGNASATLKAEREMRGLCTRCGAKKYAGPTHVCVDGKFEEDP